MRQLRSSIVISLLFHAALLACFIWGAAYLRPMAPTGGGGDGSAISVWISDAGDGTNGGHSTDRPANSKGPFPQQRPHMPMSQPHESIIPAEEADSGNHRADTAAGGDGSAIGSGSGLGLGSGSGGGAGSGGDPTLAKIWKRINGAKYYPEIARRNGLVGAPRVTFSIGNDGSVQQVRLATSCGEAILDEAAQETIRRSAPLPSYPAPITLAVQYELTKD